MKPLDVIAQDVKVGDLVRIHLNGGSFYDGHRWNDDTSSLSFSGYHPSFKNALPDEAFATLDMQNRSLDGVAVTGYEILRRETPKPRYEREPGRAHERLSEGPMRMPKPFGNSYDWELQDARDARQTALEKE